MKTTSARAAALAVLAFLVVVGSVPAGADESRLSGRVVDADTQKPVAGATVELASAGGGQGYFRARTDAHGGFVLERVPAERWYAFTVSADGYADFVLGSWQFPAAQRAADVVVPLERAGTIEVRLTGSDGRTPVVGARVAAGSQGGAGSPVALTVYTDPSQATAAQTICSTASPRSMLPTMPPARMGTARGARAGSLYGALLRVGS